jgi:hypothetical protein
VPDHGLPWNQSVPSLDSNRGRNRAARRLRRRPTAITLEPLESRTLLAFTIALVDNTGLTDYTLYAIGYATTGTPTYLVNAGNDVGTFNPYGSSAPATGKLEGIKINRPQNGPIPAVTGGISQISMVAADDLNGGAIFVVAVPDSWTQAPYVTYAGTGTSVTPPGFPTDNWPGTQPSFVYTELEFTKLEDSTLTIDSTQVNFWSMPVTGTFNALQLGQPPTLLRNKILEAYTPFINAEHNLQSPAKAALKTAYQDLYSASLGWVISPFALGRGATDMPAAFQTAWDDDLHKLFGGPGQPGMKNIRTYFPGEQDYWTGNAQAKPDGTGGFNYSLRFTKDGTKGTAANEWFEIDSPLNTASVSLYGNAGFQVYGCKGTFLNPRGYRGAGTPIGTQIVTALNRGVALLPADPKTPGSNSQLWSTQSNWYPAAQNYNNYSRFMHAAKTADNERIFVYGPSVTPVADAQGALMGPAYGFPQDENDQNFVPGQPQVGAYPVPFEFGNLADGSTVTFSFGPWGTNPPLTPFVAGTSFTVAENATNAPLTWSGPPLSGFTTAPVTVTVALDGGSANGTLTLTPAGPVTPTGSAAAGWQVAGTQAELNAYFQTAGAVTFTPSLNSTAQQQLTMAAVAGSQQAQGTSTITIVPVNSGLVVNLVPGSFTTDEATPVALAYTLAPFSDTDPTIGAANTFRVTVTAPAGTLAATSTASITVGGTPTALTFTPNNLGGAEALAALNQYFVAGSVTYTPPAGSLATQTLSTTLVDTFKSKSSNVATTQIFIGQGGTPLIDVPIAFWVKVDRRGNLVWPRGMTPFVDADSRSLTVTMAVTGGDGSLAATSRNGVTVAGDGSQRTFTGSVRNLNAFFKTAGRITYKTSGGSLLPRTLGLFASDGTRSGSASSAILVQGLRPAGRPTINAATSLGRTGRNQPLVITYDQLVAASGAGQTGSRSIEFVLAGISSGRLELFDENRWQRVPPQGWPTILPVPLLAPGGKIRWTPPANQSGRLAAFRVLSWDGLQRSVVSQVTVDVA